MNPLFKKSRSVERFQKKVLGRKREEVAARWGENCIMGSCTVFVLLEKVRVT